jgi:ABC-type branched-subunit amino acid transport system ATPase component
MDIVFSYSDRIVALHQGRVLAEGTPAAIQADQEVMNAVVGRRAGKRENGSAGQAEHV